ncbi:MAG TPA: hypothetical protein VM869_33345 [Enhygromyxa sp.]|nr:hypothetical protein [Enhygromyxa sp.]
MIAATLTLLLLGPPALEPPAPEIVEPAPAEPAPAEPEPSFDPAQLEHALARLPAGPTLAQVQAAALARAGLDPDPSARWLRRARSAAAMPIVSVQYDRRFDRNWTLDREVGQADALRNDSGNQDVLRAKATWELDRLIFDPDELRAARAVLDVAEFRERLLVEVTQLYFERERILLERELAPPTDIATAIDLNVRLREVEGLLAGLTGLDFAPPPRRDLGIGARQ